VANYHASFFSACAGGRADLTTGIGADLIALSPAIGFELDEERAEYARHNVRVHCKEAEVRVADSLAAAWDFQCAFADPARRVAGRRTLDIASFSPDPRILGRRMQELELGCIKLSPMLSDPILESLGPRLEFISFAGECREALVITGSQATPGRFAVQVDTGERLQVTDAPTHRTPAIGPGAYLYEADPAAIRAHALETLAEEFGLSPLGDSNGYLTGESQIASIWLKRYEVLYSGKADLATTRSELRRLGAAKPILKQRGANLNLAKLAISFKPLGDLSVALVIWPIGKSLRHTIVKAHN
jgi:hypothetical protein